MYDDRPMTTKDVMAALNCSYMQARNIMMHYGNRDGDSPRARWWIGEREFKLLQMEEKLPALMKRESNLPRMQKIEYSRAMREKRRAMGLCLNCGDKMPEGDTHTTCPACRAYTKKRKELTKNSDSYKAAVRYAEKRRANVCTKCRKPLPEDYTKTVCPECKPIVAAQAKKHREKRKRETVEKGLCYVCGRSLKGEPQGSTLCCICKWKQREYWRARRGKD